VEGNDLQSISRDGVGRRAAQRVGTPLQDASGQIPQSMERVDVDEMVIAGLVAPRSKPGNRGKQQGTFRYLLKHEELRTSSGRSANY